MAFLLRRLIRFLLPRAKRKLADRRSGAGRRTEAPTQRAEEQAMGWFRKDVDVAGATDPHPAPVEIDLGFRQRPWEAEVLIQKLAEMTRQQLHVAGVDDMYNWVVVRRDRLCQPACGCSGTR